MKKILFFCALFLSFFHLSAQITPPNTLIYGASPFQDSMWAVDTTAGFSIVQRTAPSLAGFTITGINGLAFDPCGLGTYAILKLSGVSGRVLAKIDLATGVCTQIGNLGTNFSSITFSLDGQLYGVTGDGASPSETLFAIDKTTGATTLLSTLGNGADGEVICYNYSDNFLYHWSGNGTCVFEKIMASSPYIVTNISGALGAGGEIFGAVYLGGNNFIISNISSTFRHLSTSGVVGATLTTLPDDLRGLVIPPRFSLNRTTACAKIDTIKVGATGVHFFDVIYAWGDGTRDTVAAGGAQHIYATSGTKNLHILLDNGVCTPDTIYSAVITVNTTPVVTISGSNTYCPGSSTTLTGSSGGTSQWYLNGVIIFGANSNTYAPSSPGIYNMIKTNLNGCADSAAVGKNVRERDMTDMNIPTIAGTYTSTHTFDDGTLVHYCDCPNNYLLLSLDTTGTGAVIPANGASLKVGTGASFYPAGTGFVYNPNGAAFFNRDWNVSATQQPFSPVIVHVYYTANDYNSVNDTLVNRGGSPLSSENDMYFYKVTNATLGAFPSIPSIGIADVKILFHSALASDSTWTNGVLGTKAFAELKVNSFSGGGGGGSQNNTPFPLSLLDFEANTLKSSVLLEWNTTSEIATDYFVIERLTSNNLFMPLATVEAIGSGNNAYRFEDFAPLEGLNLYRLKMLDMDGRFTYSHQVEVYFTPENTLKVFPNPGENHFSILVPNAYLGNFARVLNVEGEILWEGQLQSELTPLILEDLTQGFYYLQITGKSGVIAAQKFTKK